MGLDTTNFTVEQWLAIAPQCGCKGRRNLADPFTDLYTTIAQRNMPAGSPAGLPHFTVVSTASLISRGMIYFKNSPGDCGAPSPVDLTDASLAKAGGNVASQGLSFGLGAAQIGGAAAAGATFGLSAVITVITDIFQHHAQAVYTEQTTLCKVAGIVNQVIPAIDAFVRNGQQSASDAIGQLKYFVENLNAQFQAIEKSCNAACFYQGILNAHADFATSYYPALAPKSFFPVGPGSAPVVDGVAPGGVPVASVGIAHLLSGVPSVTGGFTTTDLFLAGIVLLLVMVLLFSRKGGGNG